MAVVVMSSGKVFVHFAVGEYDDHVGLGTAQRDVVAHDFIFDRVFSGGVEQYFDPLPADESHLHDAPAEAPWPVTLRIVADSPVLSSDKRIVAL